MGSTSDKGVPQWFAPQHLGFAVYGKPSNPHGSLLSRQSEALAESASPAPALRILDDENEKQARLRQKAWIERTYGPQPRRGESLLSYSAALRARSLPHC